MHGANTKNVATCFDQLHGHPQATPAHKTKVTIANFMLGRMRHVCHCYTVHTDKI